MLTRRPRFSICGITAFEAAVVLVCLSIIVGTALPYYLRLQERVRSTVMAWTSSSLQMAVVLVRTSAKLSGAKGGEVVTVERRLGEKTRVSINQLLNPTANRHGIVEAIEIPDTLGRVEVSYLKGPGTRMVIYSMRGTPQCKVTYREELMSGVIAVRKDTSDCS